MNATQSKVALTLNAAKPEKHAYASAVMDSQTCPTNCKVDASTWAEWAATDSWMVAVYKVAWAFKQSDKDFNYDAFMQLAGFK